MKYHHWLLEERLQFDHSELVRAGASLWTDLIAAQTLARASATALYLLELHLLTLSVGRVRVPGVDLPVAASLVHLIDAARVWLSDLCARRSIPDRRELRTVAAGRIVGPLGLVGVAALIFCTASVLGAGPIVFGFARAVFLLFPLLPLLSNLFEF